MPLKQEAVQEADDKKLTIDQAKELLPQAAGISNADFRALMKDPRPETVKSKSLSLVILAFRPTENPDAAKEKEFRFWGAASRGSEIFEVLWISKAKGFASLMQRNTSTECPR